ADGGDDRCRGQGKSPEGAIEVQERRGAPGGGDEDAPQAGERAEAGGDDARNTGRIARRRVPVGRGYDRERCGPESGGVRAARGRGRALVVCAPARGGA